jgi:hypothetical protein
MRRSIKVSVRRNEEGRGRWWLRCERVRRKNGEKAAEQRSEVGDI